jgi:membrane protein
MSDFWRNTVVDNNHNEKKLPLTWKRMLKIGFHLWRQFDDPYYAGFAAQIAYFFFMSSIPLLIVLTQVLGIFDISMDYIRYWLRSSS